MLIAFRRARSDGPSSSAQRTAPLFGPVAHPKINFCRRLARHKNHGKTASQWSSYLHQAFTQTILYDFKARPQGFTNRHLKIEIEVQKFVANAHDNRSTARFAALPVEIVAYLNAQPIHRQTVSLRDRLQVLAVPLGAKPDHIKIDPRRLYIDRNPQDNSARVR